VHNVLIVISDISPGADRTNCICYLLSLILLLLYYLTGYSALNKLLGREVYTSQDQLGGPQVLLLLLLILTVNNDNATTHATAAVIA
jgi:hypothetical protein